MFNFALLALFVAALSAGEQAPDELTCRSMSFQVRFAVTHTTPSHDIDLSFRKNKDVFRRSGAANWIVAAELNSGDSMASGPHRLRISKSNVMLKKTIRHTARDVFSARLTPALVTARYDEMPEGSDVLLNILIQCDNCSKSELTAAREVAGYCRSLRAKNNSEVCLGSRKPRACFKRFQRIRLIMQLSSTPDRVLGNDFICYRAENMVLSSEKGMCMSTVIPQATPVSHASVTTDATWSCSCSLLDKSVPVDEARPSELFLGPGDAVSPNFLTQVCEDNCPIGGPICVCTPADFKIVRFQEIIGLGVVFRQVPRRCDSQCVTVPTSEPPVTSNKPATASQHTTKSLTSQPITSMPSATARTTEVIPAPVCTCISNTITMSIDDVRPNRKFMNMQGQIMSTFRTKRCSWTCTPKSAVCCEPTDYYGVSFTDVATFAAVIRIVPGRCESNCT